MSWTCVSFKFTSTRTRTVTVSGNNEKTGIEVGGTTPLAAGGEMKRIWTGVVKVLFHLQTCFIAFFRSCAWCAAENLFCKCHHSASTVLV